MLTYNTIFLLNIFIQGCLLFILLTIGCLFVRFFLTEILPIIIEVYMRLRYPEEFLIEEPENPKKLK